MAVNVIVDGLESGPLCLRGEGSLSVSNIRRLVTGSLDNDGLKNVRFRLQMRSRVLEDEDVLECEEGESFLTVNVVPSLQGGKGGFGALIRAMGKSVEKSQNKDACRDLSGRRVRDVQAEKKLTEWVKKDTQGKQGDEEERIKQLEQKLAQPKHMYSDPSYMSQIHSASESLEDALKQGLEASSSGLGQKRSTQSRMAAAPKRPAKSMMWLGVEEAESDEEVESEDDGNGERAAVLPPPEGPSTSDISCSGVCPDADCDAVPSNTISPLEHPPTQEDERQPTVPVPMNNCVGSSSNGDTCAVEQEQENIVSKDHQSSASATEETHSSQCATAEHVEAEEAEDVDWRKFASAHDLEGLGRSKLKAISVSLGLKCGGTLQQLAARVFSTVGKERGEWDPHILAKSVKG